MHTIHRRLSIAAVLGALLASMLSALALQATPADAQVAEPALDWDNYEKLTLTRDMGGEPVDMAVLPDGRVLFTIREGLIRLMDPSQGTVETIDAPDVYFNGEDGMQTLTLDPDFEENGWIYVFYSPETMDGLNNAGRPYPTTTPGGNAPNSLPDGEDITYWDQWTGYNQMSRFQWDADNDTLDLSSEQVIIKVETNRGQCCHVAGDADFDDDGNLYISTGDNTPATTPGSNGYAPNNNAPGMNPGFDARRGAGSTNDLRGKILRIHPEDDGSYSIPDGNLFDEADDTADQTRPEIFVMGARNPFRMDVDSETNSVSWGDYGPDAGSADPNRGPMGIVEWNTTGIDQPINAGWPYCTGDQFNYNEWDFETATQGPWFDCAAGAENNSSWNTGLAVVPPSVPADLYYGDNDDDQPWPELTSFGSGNGQAPMGGPVYHYDASNPVSALPEYWDGKSFFAEWSQDYIAAFSVDWPDGPVTEIENFLPNGALQTAFQPIHDNIMDLEFHQGSLYTLEYGDGFSSVNPDAGLHRIDYVEGNKTPQAVASADPISGSTAPLEVTFDGSGSSDPDGDELTYEWDFDGDGTYDATGVTTSHTYTDLGVYSARLRVTDPGGRTSLTAVNIAVGNIAPTVTIETPPDGTFFDWGQGIAFEVTTSDPEDGDDTVCGNVAYTFGLGHNSHAHPITTGTGCTFSLTMPADAPEHGEGENIYAVLEVTYTDQGNGEIPPATGTATLQLNPKDQEAEWSDDSSGVAVVEDIEASGFNKVGPFADGDWISYDRVNLLNIESVAVTSEGTGDVHLRWGSPDAEPFATVAVDSSGIDTFFSDEFTPPGGTGTLYVTATDGVTLDILRFLGDGVADVTPPEVTITTIPAVPNGPDGTFIGPVQFRINATDNVGVASRQFSYDGETWGTYFQFGATFVFCNLGGFGQCQVTGIGTHTVYARATDVGGNVSEPVMIEIEIVADEVPPEVSASLLGTFTGEFTPAAGFDTAGTATMVVGPDGTSVTADLSGLVPNATHQGHLHEGVCGTMPMGGHYQDDPDGPSEPPNELWLVDDPENPDAGFVSDTDGEAQVSGSADWTAREDAQAVMVHGGDAGLPRGCATVDTASSSVQVTFEATDIGAVDYIEYSLDGAEFVELEGDLSVIEPGDHTVEYRAVDTAGNTSETGTASFTIEHDPDVSRILVFSKTAAFRHGSIPVAREAIQELGAADGVAVDLTEDAAAFNDDTLARYDAVVWVSTTGDVLDDDQQAAFERYIQAGGGYAGVHAASDTEYGWEWYGDLVGAYFEGHPPGTPQATLNIEDGDHPSTDHLPEDWTRDDEWYSFQDNPRGDVHVLMTIDESTYAVGDDLAMGDHPMSWCHDFDGGRSWYTALGHTDASFTTDELFREHMWEGISTAAGWVEADCSVPEPLFLDVVLDPATPDGDDGWYVSPVTVTATTTDDATIEFSVDGGAWVADEDGVLTVSEDGSHTLDVRAVRDPEVTEVQSFTMDVDTTEPTTDIDGVDDGATYGSSEVLDVEVSADDATSGVDTLTVTLDGQVVHDGDATWSATWSLWELDLGGHTLEVDAVDVAGNTTSSSVSFTIETSYDDVLTLLEVLTDAGVITPEEAQDVRDQVNNAERMADKGKDVQEGRALERAIDRAERIDDPDVRALLIRDLQALLDDV
ncbi:ThuA domain-containing protein [Salsipaludibacter albus]|uniref:ThuA domain-containing protein n=1 Tax=Salsipaludibacter albus TaxID=2849650 RepID=UPI002368D19E|nr:ThuA domain-containing protein [Salsipaludibacter albus]MBY5161403.1 ThuA domain-containing protein [Salsipaludibacter albus]